MPQGRCLRAITALGRRPFCVSGVFVDLATPAPSAAPAPAAAPVTTTISATRDAANTGDFSKFQEAHDAGARGETPARVEAVIDPKADEPVPRGTSTTPPPAAPPVSKRQQATNDAIRTATERAVADATAADKAEIARLQALIPKGDAAPRREAVAPAAPAAPASPTVPEYRRIAALPDAPKIDDVDADGKPVYESLGEHAAAMALFVNQTREQEARAKQSNEQHERHYGELSQQYGDRLREAAQAEPDLISKIPPALVDAVPMSSLPRGSRATFANVVAEAGLQSENPARLYKHLHAHQDQTLAIAKQHPSQWLSALNRLDGRLAGPVEPAPSLVAAEAPPAAVHSTVTAAPPPPPSLKRSGTSADPKAAALARGDFATFQKIDLQEKVAARAHA